MPDIFTPQIKKQPAPAAQSVAEDIPHREPGLFSAYCPHPSGISFAHQEPDEHIMLFLRRHFITNIRWIINAILLLLAPIPLAALLRFTNITFVTITPQLQFSLGLFYYIVVLNYAFVKFITWFYHVGIVSQKRLLDLDVDNILHYHLAETNISDVVDVSHSQKGFFQSFLNYGDVPIQTEAIKANFEFEATPHPANVADIITDLRGLKKGAKLHA
jgi:hypothetical protein